MLDTLSEEDAKKLLDDRVQFKLYAAEQHLKNLQNLDKNGKGINSSFQSRVYSEMEIESLLLHLIDSVDALLFRINDKLNLNLEEVGLHSSLITVMFFTNKLNTLGKGQLLTDLQDAVKPNKWFRTLRDLRNNGTQRYLINTQVTPGDRGLVQLFTKPQTESEVLPYLEDSFNKTKNLIENIINNEPLLKM